MDLEDIEAEVEAASEAVNVAVAAALTPVVREMLEEAEHFRAEFLARKYALDVMCARWGSLSELGRAIERLWIATRVR